MSAKSTRFMRSLLEHISEGSRDWPCEECGGNLTKIFGMAIHGDTVKVRGYCNQCDDYQWSKVEKTS